MILNLARYVGAECKLTIFADGQLARGLVMQRTIQLWISRTNWDDFELLF
jgi:hypothetical protein